MSDFILSLEPEPPILDKLPEKPPDLFPFIECLPVTSSCQIAWRPYPCRRLSYPFPFYRAAS
jgi:hypothetical protein